MPSSAAPSPTPPAARRRWLLMLGWLLTLPGLWVIASFLLFTPVSQWAGCPAPLGVDFRPCPPGPLAGLADAMRQSVAITLIASFIGVGALPPLYTGVFIAARMALRVEKWWRACVGAPGRPASTWRSAGIAAILFFVLVMAAGMVARMLADASTARLSLKEFAEGILGLTAMAGVVYGGYRLVRWSLGKLRGA